MAEGNFYPNAALHLQIEGDTYKVSMTNSMKEDAPDYTGEATLRVYCEDADNTVVWVEQDGEYREVESTVIGSYRQFTMEVPGSFRIAEAEGSHTRMIVMCIIGVAVGILLIVLLVKKVAKRRKKRRQEKRSTPGRRMIQRDSYDPGSNFDMDGTLIDTEKYYRIFWPKALEAYGYTMTDEQALTMRSLGRPFAPRQLKDWYGEDFDYYVVRDKRKEMMEETLDRDGIKCKPGAVELLEDLKKGISPQRLPQQRIWSGPKNI